MEAIQTELRVLVVMFLAAVLLGVWGVVAVAAAVIGWRIGDLIRATDWWGGTK